MTGIGDQFGDVNLYIGQLEEIDRRSKLPEKERKELEKQDEKFESERAGKNRPGWF